MDNGEKDGDRNFEYTAYTEPDAVGKYLEDLARYIREGHVHLAVGNEGIQLDLGTNVKLELEARVKADKGKGNLQLGISWRQAQQNGDALRIEATGPEPAEDKDAVQEEATLDIGRPSRPKTSKRADPVRAKKKAAAKR